MAQTSPESFKFKTEVQQLLNILVHSLYTDKEIFLRELISNASDALNRMQFEMLTNHDVLDPEVEPGIWISGDEENKTLTIRDTGIGMTREELIDNLGTIAKSGAADFIARLKDNKEQVADVIGQFGVGFYSVFMVAKEVEVVSRSYRKDAEAVKWVSDGSESYTIQAADKADRGTTITITLHDEDAEFAQEYRLRNIIKKHSDFVNYPIYLGDGEEPVNQQTPIWRQSPSEIDEEKYKEFYKQLTLDFEDPITYLHLSADAPVQVNALLYFPAKREGNVLSLRKDPGLKLYSHNVLIQEYNTDLLPNHFRFVQGVVDSEDISLSVSREAVQNTRVIEKLKNLLTKRVTRKLEELGKEDPDAYAKWWKEFGLFIKEGIATDFSAKDSLAKLLRFYSSASPDKLISLAEYAAAMPEDQDDIYYLLADSVAAAQNSPHLDDFKKRDIQVLYLVDTLDSFMLTTLREFDGHPLKNADSAEL
ncbi:MAG TPA: molecular chaperone HtpG, partial [Anaerolineae bacterium]|nr:molecular chaperone HtpG [Anaerolineae bacterium]